MRWHPEIPFNSLPSLPPAGIDLEPKSVLKATIDARAALATLAAAGKQLPNPRVLLHAVPLLEAEASSEIENIVTTADENSSVTSLRWRNHAKEALRYRGAIFSG